MRVIRTDSFEHEGKKYELRLFSNGWNFTVKAFYEGREANGYSYSVSLPTAFDLKTVRGADAIEVLFENARNDIREKIWERYVDTYLKSLNLKEDEGLGCQHCTGRDIAVSNVDERRLYRCRTCGNIWYEERKVTGPVLAMLDDITDDVIKKDYHETFVEVLLNCVFPEHEQEGPSFEEQLQNWCNQNYLDYEMFDKEDIHGKMCQMIRFYRKLA